MLSENCGMWSNISFSMSAVTKNGSAKFYWTIFKFIESTYLSSSSPSEKMVAPGVRALDLASSGIAYINDKDV